MSCRSRPSTGAVPPYLHGHGLEGRDGRAEASAEHRGLAGTFKLTIGDDFYSQPYYAITLAQSGTGATGTLSDYPRTGVMDMQTPGTVDENGRFRLRFPVRTDTDEFVLSGELIAATRISFGDIAIATGQVVSGRHAGRRFRICLPRTLSPRRPRVLLQPPAAGQGAERIDRVE